MLNKGAELSCMMEIICLAVMNLTSFWALSSSRMVFCLYLAHPQMVKGLAALPAGAPYAWDTPVTPPATTWHSVHISYFPCSALLTVSLSDIPCVCQPALSRVWGPMAGGRLQPPQLLCGEGMWLPMPTCVLDRSRPAPAHPQSTWHTAVT